MVVASPGLGKIAIPDQIRWEAQTFYDQVYEVETLSCLAIAVLSPGSGYDIKEL